MRLIKTLLISLCIVLSTSVTAANKEIKVKISTNQGDMIATLFADQSPVSVANFMSYVNEGFYDGTIFHRVIKNFMIQGGGFDTNMSQKQTKSPIKNEASNRLRNERGTLAFARTRNPNSATSQFFINVKDNTFLNQSPGNSGYAVFGKVIQGMEIADKISKSRTTRRNGMGDVPSKKVVIYSITEIK